MYLKCPRLLSISVQNRRSGRAASFRAPKPSAPDPMKSPRDMTTRHGESRAQRAFSTLKMCRSHRLSVETVPRRRRLRGKRRNTQGPFWKMNTKAKQRRFATFSSWWRDCGAAATSNALDPRCTQPCCIKQLSYNLAV